MSQQGIIERFLGELQASASNIAVESLTNPDRPDAFGFGRAVGRLEGLRLAEEALNKILHEPEGD